MAIRFVVLVIAALCSLVLLTASISDASPASASGISTSPASAAKSVAYQINVAHTGATEMDGFIPPLTKRWEVDLGTTVSYPLIADGKVFVTTAAQGGGYGTLLHEFDAATGARAWPPLTIPGTYFWSGAAYDAGRIFVVNFDGRLRAIDATNGAELWDRQLPGQYAFTSPPVADQGVVYVGGAGSGGTLYAVDATNGTVLWTAPVENGDHSSPALSSDSVFVSYACARAYRFNRATGAHVWDYYGGCEGGGGKTPVLFNDRLYVRDAFSPPQFIFDAQTGSVAGRFDGDVTPVFAGDLGLFLSGGVLRAKRVSDGSALWQFSGDGSLHSPPVIVGGYAYAGSTSGTVYALDMSTGQQVWSRNAGASIEAPDEHNAMQLTGLGAGENLLVVPTSRSLVAYSPGVSSPPAIQSLIINGGARSSTSPNVTLSLTASDDVGVIDMSFSNDGSTWSVWRSFADAIAWGLSPGDGPKTVYARVRDQDGNVSQAVSATIELAATLGQEYGLSINDAAPYARTADVTLSVPARPGTTQMQISNDGAFSAATWEPYAAHKPWHINESGTYGAPRTVYARFKDANGATTSTFHDDIILDLTPPTGSVSFTPARNATVIRSDSLTQSLALSASDDLSPPALIQMHLSNRDDFAGAIWRSFVDHLDWDFAGGATVYVQFRDGAGNLSPVYQQSTGSPPGGPAIAPVCSPRPRVLVATQRNAQGLSVTLSTTGANNGLRAVRFDSFANAIVDVGDQLNQSSPFAVSIPTGTEPMSLSFTIRRPPNGQGQSSTVRLVVFDGCGEWSTFVGGGPAAF